MERTPLKKVGKKGKRTKKELDAITPALKERSKGLCENCGKLGRWPGKGWRFLERMHKDNNRNNNTLENVEMWCWFCHHGPDGHRDYVEPK